MIAVSAIAQGFTITAFSALDENKEWFESASLNGEPMLSLG